MPPVKGFWSLTLYTQHHSFRPNELKRYSLGTKNKTLQYAADGSLTIDVGATPPDEVPHSNWLPSPDGEFSLYVRAYWPDAPITDGFGRRPRSHLCLGERTRVSDAVCEFVGAADTIVLLTSTDEHRRVREQVSRRTV